MLIAELPWVANVAGWAIRRLAVPRLSMASDNVMRCAKATPDVIGTLLLLTMTRSGGAVQHLGVDGGLVQEPHRHLHCREYALDTVIVVGARDQKNVHD